MVFAVGFSINSQVYKGSVKYLDSKYIDLGYTDINTKKGTTIPLNSPNPFSVHQIVKPGYYRLDLPEFLTYFGITAGAVMSDTKLPSNSRVLIKVPENHIKPMSSKDSNAAKSLLGGLALTEVLANTDVTTDEKISSAYQDIYTHRIPYFKPKVLASCNFVSSTGKKGIIDTSWSRDDILGITDLQIKDDNTGNLNSVDFYVENEYEDISIYIEGYRFDLCATEDICFIGEPFSEFKYPATPEAPMYFHDIYDALPYDKMEVQSESNSVIPGVGTWGYKLPFTGVPFASSSPVPRTRLIWSADAPYPAGCSLFDDSVKIGLPYNPNVYLAIGELPATNIATLPYQIDLNRIGVSARANLNTVGVSSSTSYLPPGVYILDRDNISKYGIFNTPVGVSYMFGIEVKVSDYNPNDIIQKVFNSLSTSVYYIRVGYYSDTTFTWKNWTYYNC